ncbi:MAG: hypothetical protein IJ599_00350 [Alphaproteobacteria bacterium]|nr:hypothetical protein [Alphaproteobacteria bacterium]
MLSSACERYDGFSFRCADAAVTDIAKSLASWRVSGVLFARAPANSRCSEETDLAS